MVNFKMTNKDNKFKQIDEWSEKTTLDDFIKILKKYNMAQEKESKTNWHFRISLVKSVLRICAGGYLILGEISVAGGLLIAAEVLGIVEEL